MSLRKSEVWKESFQNTTIEIIKWNFDSESMQRIWKANWNYYVYLYETHCKDFDTLWLPDIVKSWRDGGPTHVSHEYCQPFADVDLHGGITYYAKHGYSVGHRCVQIGCDFQHLWDEGKTYTVEGIYREAKASAEQCVELFYAPRIELVEASK